jgi:hypothetical protein
VLTGASSSDEMATWWNKNGVGEATINNGSDEVLNGSSGSYFIMVQVDTGIAISTFSLTENLTPDDTCYFTGQVIKSNG